MRAIQNESHKTFIFIAEPQPTLTQEKLVQGESHTKLLLSGKILRTGFPVQQFHICASRGFLTLMAAKAINGH